MGNVEGTNVGGGHSKNGYTTGYHAGGYNGSGYQSGGYTSQTSTEAIECESQIFKSHIEEWATRNGAYDSYWMQRVDDYYNNILDIVDEANNAIDNSGIDFLDLGHIKKAYTKADVTDMEERRTNLADFTSSVQTDVINLIDNPFYQKLYTLSGSMKDYADLNIVYLGTPFDLEYNIADPQYLSDWLWKAEFGEEDDFLFTGDDEKDTLIREYLVKDSKTGRYVYEAKIEDWENLSDKEKETVRHLTEHFARHYEEYYDDDLTPCGQYYRDHSNRIANACMTVEVIPEERDQYNNVITEGTRVYKFSDAGKELMGMCDKDGYAWTLLNRASGVEIDLRKLAEEVDPEDSYKYIDNYGDRFSGAALTISFGHDRAATTMDVSVTSVKGGDFNAEHFYEDNKDSFKKINKELAENNSEFFTDYRRCYDYINKNAELHPTKYTHQADLGMDHARLALFLSAAENHADMECLDEMITSYGGITYNNAFSVDASELSDAAKAQIQKYIEVIKGKAFDPNNPNQEACAREICGLYAYFTEATSKSVTEYWPICKDILTEIGTTLIYDAYGNEYSSAYDPEFAADLKMAEGLIDGSIYMPTEAREAWLADEQHQKAYITMLQVKNPDMFKPYWPSMSSEQREQFGRTCASIDKESGLALLARVDAEYRAEAYYYYGEASGFNAKASAIYDKIEEKTIYDYDVGTEQVSIRSYLTEEEIQIVHEYVSLYSSLDIMTQEQYEMLDVFSDRIIDDYERDHSLECILDFLFDKDYLEYKAFTRRNEDDILYLVAKEAKNTAYVHDESLSGTIEHKADAVLHGVTNIKKNFDDLGYAIQKKYYNNKMEDMDKNSEEYKECAQYVEFLDYSHALETQEYEQAKEFSEGGYIIGQIGTDLFLMWVGGELLEAAGVAAATADGLTALGFSEGTAKIMAGVAMEQVMPTVLYIVPNGINNYLNGMSLKDVFIQAGKEELFNIIMSTAIHVGQAKLSTHISEEGGVVVDKGIDVVDETSNVLDSADAEKLSHWNNAPDEECYLRSKEIYDNPKYFNQDTGELVNDVKLFSENENALYKYKEIQITEAEQTNRWFVDNVDPNYKPPYKPGTLVEEIELAEDTTFVRVYDNMPDGSKMHGGWIMRPEDIEGLTPLQIQEKFALPSTPKYICDVELEAGTHLRVGEVNPLEGWGSGGGTQYDLIGQRVGNFTNERLLESSIVDNTLYTHGTETSFTGKLRGEDVTLKNVQMQEISYVKRNTEELQNLRNEFNSTSRKAFLEELGKDSDYLKEAGFSQSDILKIKNGRVPDGWQVHHKLPLDDSGTNSFDNLVLIQNEPYHKVITVYQNSVARNMTVGDAQLVQWPLPDGKIYPSQH